MRIYFLIIIITLLTSTQNEFGKLLDHLNKVDFNLNTFKLIIKDEFCVKHFIKDIQENQVECKLSNSIIKGLNAKQVIITTEPIRINTKTESLSLIISEFDRKDSKALQKLKEDYENLASILNRKFKFHKREFHKGGESAERLTNEFISESNTTIKLVRLLGGCFRKKQIIISIFSKK